MLRADSHELVDLLHVLADVQPLDQGRTARGLKKARQDIDCRRLGDRERCRVGNIKLMGIIRQNRSEGRVGHEYQYEPWPRL